MHTVVIEGLSPFTCPISNAMREDCVFFSKGIIIQDNIYRSGHQFALLSVSAFLSHNTKIQTKNSKNNK